jgi:DNA-binding Lrp family transcriptional regulator
MAQQLNFGRADLGPAAFKEPSQLSEVERKLINILSFDLSLSPQPYADLAKELGVSEAEAISAIEKMLSNGLIRRLGAVIAHQKSGFAANAMIVWLFSEDRLDQVGELFASRPRVSHCYRRRPLKDWPYNLYTMIHAEDRPRLLEMAREMAEMSSPLEWRVLESLKEFKKKSLRLFL